MNKTLASPADCGRFFCPIFLLLYGAAVQALEPAYLEEFPDLERIIADTESKDPFDALAKQTGIVRQLRELINVMAGQRRWDNKLTADEKRLQGAYWEADAKLQKLAEETVAPKVPNGKDAGPWTKWFLKASHYELDEALRASVLSSYFSEPTLRRIGQADLASEAMAARGRELLRGNERRPDKIWDRQTAEQKIESIAIMVVLSLLLLPSLYRETRRFGIDPKDPFKLQAGFRRFQLHWFTGTVTDYSQHTETTTTTTTTRRAEGGTSHKVNVSKTMYESFNLVRDGDKHHVYLSDAQLNFSNGDLVTALWAIRKGKDEGPYILFLDRRAGHAKQVRRALWKLFMVRYWLFLPLLPLAFWIGLTTDLLRFGPNDPTSSSMRGYMAVLFGWILGMILFWWIASRRAKRFTKRDSGKILEAVKKEEEGVAVAG